MAERSSSPPACESRRFLALDLAWSSRNPSGLAALDELGRVVALRADIHDDDASVAWVREHLAATTVIGIDMPTIVRNPSGARECERALASLRAADPPLVLADSVPEHVTARGRVYKAKRAKTSSTH